MTQHGISFFKLICFFGALHRCAAIYFQICLLKVLDRWTTKTTPCWWRQSTPAHVVYYLYRLWCCCAAGREEDYLCWAQQLCLRQQLHCRCLPLRNIEISVYIIRRLLLWINQTHRRRLRPLYSMYLYTFVDSALIPVVAVVAEKEKWICWEKENSIKYPFWEEKKDKPSRNKP